MTTALEALNRRAGSDRRLKTDGALAAGLLAALERREIEVRFQPLFGAVDSEIVGAEALARWRHPEGMLIGGEQLFALARRAGRTQQVTAYLARSAMVAAQAWPARLRLALNITAADLAAPDFAEAVDSWLAETGFAPQRLTLEITEQALVAELAAATDQLRLLAARGIQVALDDFGAGFCNFGYLKQLPLNAIKLDRIMVQGIADDPRDLAVLRGVIDMAQALGLAVIAEGIETEAQRAAIVGEGCRAWQGFLGSAPISAEAFLALTAAG